MGGRIRPVQADGHALDARIADLLRDVGGNHGPIGAQSDSDAAIRCQTRQSENIFPIQRFSPAEDQNEGGKSCQLLDDLRTLFVAQIRRRAKIRG